MYKRQVQFVLQFRPAAQGHGAEAVVVHEGLQSRAQPRQRARGVVGRAVEAHGRVQALVPGLHQSVAVVHFLIARQQAGQVVALYFHAAPFHGHFVVAQDVYKRQA